MEDIVILDTMALINILERCESKDLFSYFEKLSFKFKIVNTVMNEYKQGQREPGISRIKKYIEIGLIEIVAREIEGVDISNITKLKGLHNGELVSALYFLENQDKYKFVSDEKLVHKKLDEEFRVKCQWTTYLLQILIDNNFISAMDAEKIYDEMKQNGFYGLKKVSFE